MQLLFKAALGAVTVKYFFIDYFVSAVYIERKNIHPKL
jgi:hypothetical protein